MFLGSIYSGQKSSSENVTLGFVFKIWVKKEKMILVG